jgi:hypothetical protein
MAIALYDYKAQRSDELDLIQGDEIFVLIRDSPGWWMGELVKNRKQGYFPVSYVQEKKNGAPLSIIIIILSKMFLKVFLLELTVKDVMTKYNALYEEPVTFFY